MKSKLLIFFIAFLSFEIILVEANSAETLREDFKNIKNRIMKKVTGNESYAEEQQIKEASKKEKEITWKEGDPTNLRQDFKNAKKKLCKPYLEINLTKQKKEKVKCNFLMKKVCCMLYLLVVLDF